jgi:hypothetical protein
LLLTQGGLLFGNKCRGRWLGDSPVSAPFLCLFLNNLLPHLRRRRTSLLYSWVEADKFQAAWTPPVTVNLGTKNFALQNNFHIVFLYSNTLLYIFIPLFIFLNYFPNIFTKILGPISHNSL